MTAKLDLYKQHKAEYVTPKDPALIDVGQAKYLAVQGMGDPGGEVFQERIGTEGRCVQVLHRGPYEDEPATIARMLDFVREQQLAVKGPYHEIYLSDPRRTAPENLKTILRLPVKKR